MAGNIIGRADIEVGASTSKFSQEAISGLQPELDKVSAAVDKAFQQGFAKSAAAAAKAIGPKIIPALGAVTQGIARVTSEFYKAKIAPTAFGQSVAAVASKVSGALSKPIGAVKNLGRTFSNSVQWVGQIRSVADAGTVLGMAMGHAGRSVERLGGPFAEVVSSARNVKTAFTTAFREPSTVAANFGGVIQQVAARAGSALGGIARFASPALAVLGPMAAKASTAVGAAFRNVGQHVGSAIQSIPAAFQKVWDKVEAGAKAVGSTIGDALKVTGKVAAAAAGTAIGAAAGLAIGKGMGRLVSLDTATAKMKGLGYEGKNLDAVMKTVDKAVTGTVFSMGEGADAAALMLTSSVKSGKQLDNVMSAIAASASATGTGMNDIAGIFQRIAANGKVGTEELNRFAERGVNAAGALAKHFGVTEQEARAMVTAGKVSLDDFSAAMTSSMGGMAQAVGNSFSGLRANITTAFGRIGAAVLDPLFQGVKGAMPGILASMKSIASEVSTLMEPVAERIKPVFDRIGEFFNKLAEKGDILKNLSGNFEGLAGVIAPLAGLATGFLGPMLANIPVVGGLLNGLTGPVGLVMALFGLMVGQSEDLRSAFTSSGSAISDIFSGLKPIFQGVSDVVLEVAGTLGDTFAQVLNIVLPLIADLAQQFGSALGPAISQAAPILGQLVEVLGGALTDALTMVAPLISELASAILPVLVQMFTALMPVILQLATTLLPPLVAIIEMLLPPIVQLITMALPILMQLFTAAMPIIQQVIVVVGMLLEALLPIVAVILENLIPVIESLMPIVQTVFNAILNIVSGVMTAIQGVINIVLGVINGNWSQVWEGIKQFFSGIWQAISGIVTGAVATVKGVITAGLGVIKSIWNAAWSVVSNFLSNTWNSIKSVVSGAIGAVGSSISSGVNSIKSAWTSAWNSVKTTLSNAWNSIKSTATNGINNVVSTVRQLPGKAASALGNIGSTLASAGRNLIQGFIGGITSMFDKVKGALGKLTSWLPSWKGPPSKDKKLLEGPAKLIMGGFIRGLEGEYGAVKKSLEGFSDDLARTAFADITVPGMSVVAPARVAMPASARTMTPAPTYPSPVDSAGTGAGSGITASISREDLDYLVTELARLLMPMAQASGIVHELARSGPNKLRRGEF